MDSIELNCGILPDNEENRGLLTALLMQNGYESFMETDNGLNAYIDADKFEISFVIGLKDNKLPFTVLPNFCRIADKNWNEVWMNNYFNPIVFEDKLVVRASFHKNFPKTETELIIDPKRAFGTGNHSTTYLIIEEILKLDVLGKNVLDVGCGTAILSILCCKKGATKALAIDNDENACINAKENIQVNSVKGLKVIEGTAANITGNFDIIFENIWKNIVLNDIPTLFKHTNPGGNVFLSGFFKEDAKDIITCAENVGYKFLNTIEKGEWALVKLEKPAKSEKKKTKD